MAWKFAASLALAAGALAAGAAGQGTFAYCLGILSALAGFSVFLFIFADFAEWASQPRHDYQEPRV